VFAGGMDAHFLGTSAFFMPWQALRYIVIAAITLQGMTWWH
jgi:membrane protein YqaA with SNARE-associated domain